MGYEPVEDASGDGSVVLGSTGLIWSESNGWNPQLITEILESNGIDTSSINALYPTAISEDGSTIVGFGYFDSGQENNFRLQILNMFGQHRIHNGIAETGDWLGRVHAMHDPWIWCEMVPCWFNIPEQTASTGNGWVYPPNQDNLQMVQIDGTDWGYSFALDKWMYLTEHGWVYMV